MAPIGLGIATAIQGGSIALDTTDAAAVAQSHVVYHVPPPSKTPAAPSDTPQQDTVTLSGTTPATGNSANSNGFVPVAAFTLLAQEFTFPPGTSAEGASEPAAVTANSGSNATPTDQATASQQQPAHILAQESANTTAAAIATVSGQSSTDDTAANSAADPANSATATSASLTAPQETLQQLDRELQRLGINPQDISLMNRMALLFWVNDPAALRQFVQGMQPSGASSQPNALNNATGRQTGVPQLSGGAPANQNQGISTTGLSLGSPSQNQSPAATQNQSPSEIPNANQNSDGAQTGGAPIASANTPGAPLQQNSVAVSQFQELQISLAAAGQGSQAAFVGSAGSSVQDHLVNISV